MAIVEAASCGLLVVSTKVGGVPEVLPDEMLRLAIPDDKHLTKVLSEAISDVKEKRIDTSSFHGKVAKMYSWHDVAERTERIYQSSHELLESKEETTLFVRMQEYYGCGKVFGKISCMLLAIDFLLFTFLEWLIPKRSIDICPDFSREEYFNYLRNSEQ